jgi:uncharacterized repeat protein (TIGR03803 family)
MLSAADGTLHVLHDFASSTQDASNPSGPLIQGADGDFYGTSSGGGTLGGGTVFRMSATGQVTVLHNFAPGTAKGGSMPMGGVVQGANGSFYGVTFAGGTGKLGTVFVMSGSGATRILHNFSAADQVSSPCDTLAIATDRNMYGTAASCVDGKCGNSAVFEVTAQGVFTVLHRFDPAVDGSGVSGPLLLATNGTFFGTAESGGSGGAGTVYGLNTGLAPFVSVAPALGQVGAQIGISGQGFTPKGTKVSFKGTQAKVTFLTANYVVATVPAGAVSGPVIVKTPGGTLKSLQMFTILP